MDTELVAWDVPGNFRHNFFHLVRQGTAIGVTQDRPTRAIVEGGLHTSQRIVWIGLITIKKVLAIDHGLPATGDDRPHTIRNTVEIFFVGDAQCDIHMEVPAFANKADSGRGTVENSGQARVIVG